MSGVNAHATFGAASTPPLLHGGRESEVLFRRSRFWPSCRPHEILHRWSGLELPSRGVFDVQLTSVRTSWVGDHRVNGRPILPGSAMLDISFTVGSLMTSSGADQAGIFGATFSTPCVVDITPSPRGVVSCRVEVLMGAVALQSGSRLNFKAGISCKFDSTAAPATSRAYAARMSFILSSMVTATSLFMTNVAQVENGASHRAEG